MQQLAAAAACHTFQPTTFLPFLATSPGSTRGSEGCRAAGGRAAAAPAPMTGCGQGPRTGQRTALRASRERRPGPRRRRRHRHGRPRPRPRELRAEWGASGMCRRGGTRGGERGGERGSSAGGPPPSWPHILGRTSAGRRGRPKTVPSETGGRTQLVRVPQALERCSIRIDPGPLRRRREEGQHQQQQRARVRQGATAAATAGRRPPANQQRVRVVGKPEHRCCARGRPNAAQHEVRGTQPSAEQHSAVCGQCFAVAVAWALRRGGPGRRCAPLRSPAALRTTRSMDRVSVGKYNLSASGGAGADTNELSSASTARGARSFCCTRVGRYKEVCT